MNLGLSPRDLEEGIPCGYNPTVCSYINTYDSGIYNSDMNYKDSNSQLYQHKPYHEQSEPKLRNKCAVCLKVSLLLFAVIVISCVISVLSNKYITSLNTKMCVPCDSLRLSTSEHDDFRQFFRQVTSKDGESLDCCADTTDQFNIMLSTVSINKSLEATEKFLWAFRSA